jgi:ABC-type nitrate/sulfonate/bicarbonate transport system substrate-binding protein
LRSLAYHTIAVNTEGDISTLLTLALLTENGVRTSKVSIRQGFPLLNVASALGSGQADAAPIPEPFASEG